MSDDHIALALGITRPTLQKHFMVDLARAVCRRRMDVLQALYRAARRGSVSAQKEFLRRAPESFSR